MMHAIRPGQLYTFLPSTLQLKPSILRVQSDLLVRPLVLLKHAGTISPIHSRCSRMLQVHWKSLNVTMLVWISCTKKQQTKELNWKGYAMLWRPFGLNRVPMCVNVTQNYHIGSSTTRHICFVCLKDKIIFTTSLWEWPLDEFLPWRGRWSW